MGRPNILERGYIKVDLIRDLAQGDQTQIVLAQKYGVTQGAISQFASRHAEEIGAVRADLDNEFAGIWIASKRKRLGALSGEADRLYTMLEDEQAKPKDQQDYRAITALTRELRSTARNVAEELGELKTTVALDASVLRIELHGVDEDKL